MLTRSIDLDDPYDLTFEEKIFRNAKRLCIIFAAAAVTLSGLDLVNEHAVVSGAEYVQRVRLGSLASAIDHRLGAFSFAAASPSVAVAIPAAISVAEAAPVTELAAARHQDAVTMAMIAPPVMSRLDAPWPSQAHADAPAAAPKPATTADTAPLPPPPNDASAPAAKVQLASLGPDAIPPAEPIAPVISLPSVISVLPVRPPPMSPAQRLHLQGAGRAKAENCLARAVYFEARDQPYRGQVAVAQVVINRVFSPFYPDDVCAVIYQNASHHLACQFTFACDGRPEVIRERRAWARARRIARKTLDGKLYVRAVGTATHYHAVYVRPNWVREMHRLVREGSHTFYRPIAWGNGSNLPIYSREELASNHKRRR